MRSWRLLLLGLAAAALALGLAPARATGDHAAAFVERIAGERASRGLGHLTVAGDLVAVAERHAERMVERGKPYHNPALGQEVTGWEVVGENVGRGVDVETLHNAFMASATHRDQVLFPGYTEIGVGVVEHDGQLWVAQVFREPLAQTATPTPATLPPTGRSEAAGVTEQRAPSASPEPDEAAPGEPTGTTATPAPGRVAVVADLREADRRSAWSAPAIGDPARAVAEAAADVPLPVAVATGLLAAVVGAQGLTLRRLGLA